MPSGAFSPAHILIVLTVALIVLGRLNDAMTSVGLGLVNAVISTATAIAKWIRRFRCVRRTWMIPSNA